MSHHDGLTVQKSFHALIVEDTASIAKLVQRGLLLEGIRADIAPDGMTALAHIRDQQPELVILDLMLPGIDGMEICRRIREVDRVDGRAPTMILMLTARGTIADRVSGLDAGADDYLTKPFSIDEFLARVRALVRRGSVQAADTAPSQELEYNGITVDLSARTAHSGSRLLMLTAREFDLLTLFLRHPNQVLHHEQIRERVWGDDFFGESNVIAVTIGSLRRELEMNGGARLVQTVRGVGYVLRRPSETAPTAEQSD